jgi:hypothetical protein
MEVDNNIFETVLIKADHSGRVLRYELSSLARRLGSCVRIPLKAWMSVCVYSVFLLSCVSSSLATG